MDYILDIQDVHKTFKKGKVHALKGLNLQVKTGDFFGLLGPNGAGKSTLINIISSLTHQDSGDIYIFGKDFEKYRNDIKKNIGIVPQEFNFNIFEKVMDIVVTQAGYYGIFRSVAIKRAEFLLKKLDLWEKRNTQAMRLSGGMKRRLMIARSLAHSPKLLLLDEPTTGIDVEVRKETWKFLNEINQEGITIILTTHYLEEAESLCKNVAIIKQGEIISCKSIKELSSLIQFQTLLIDVDSANSLQKLEHQKIPIKIIDNEQIEVAISESFSIYDLMQELKKYNVMVKSIRNKTNRLEELFLKVLKK